MSAKRRTVIVTGASQGIGAAVANLFIERGYSVVANSRDISRKNELKRSDNLALVDGDIGSEATARKIVDTAVQRFGTVDVVVNNAGIFFAKPFTEFTTEEYRKLISTNLDGFVFLTQVAIRRMLEQKSGGSVISISSSLTDNPNVSLKASVSMITKGGIDSISRSLAMEYAKQGIRVNVVAPGIVDTPLHKATPREFMHSASPMGSVALASEIAEAVLYLSEARQITGETLHVDGGAHLGHW